jgi:hypothetical protein
LKENAALQSSASSASKRRRRKYFSNRNGSSSRERPPRPGSRRHTREQARGHLTNPLMNPDVPKNNTELFYALAPDQPGLFTNLFAKRSQRECFLPFVSTTEEKQAEFLKILDRGLSSTDGEYDYISLDADGAEVAVLRIDGSDGRVRRRESGRKGGKKGGKRGRKASGVVVVDSVDSRLKALPKGFASMITRGVLRPHIVSEVEGQVKAALARFEAEPGTSKVTPTATSTATPGADADFDLDPGFFRLHLYVVAAFYGLTATATSGSKKKQKTVRIHRPKTAEDLACARLLLDTLSLSQFMLK